MIYSMKRITLITLSVLLLAVSCSKDKRPSEFKDTDIVFSASDASATKALMDDAALQTSGNTIHVFDQLTGFTGTASWMDADSYYIDEVITYSGNPVWDFSSGRAYPWTTDGEHLFYGWLNYDSDMDMSVDDFCSPSFNKSTKVMSIPVKEMNLSTDQFDFMYSDVVLIDAAARTSNTPVALQLNHLFTAFEVNLSNTSGNTVLLKSVKITGLKNSRSATIAFDASSPTVTTSNLSSTDIVIYTSTDPDGDTFIHQDLVRSLSEMKLMWPQTYVELNGAQIEVVYHIIDSHDVVSDELTSTVVLSNQTLFKTNSTGMDAGTKYTFLLQFKKSTIDLQVRVLPWEYETFDWNYADRSISARSGMFKDGVLAFYRYNPETDQYDINPTADEWSAKALRFNTRSEVMEGKFYIESPYEGRWQVTPYPASAAQYFVVTPTSGDIDVTRENGLASFTVSVNPDLSPTSTQSLYFSVALYFNGEWTDANSEFNRKNIRLVLDAN